MYLGIYLIGLIIAFVFFSYKFAYDDYYMQTSSDGFASFLISLMWPAIILIGTAYYPFYFINKVISKYARNKKEKEIKDSLTPAHHKTSLGKIFYKKDE